MRRTWLAVVLLAVALLVQLTALNGLHLPGGGVPDLILIMVVALAVAGGPLPGTVIGFAAGLCVDLAPPGSAAIGQYAFVFCLAGWTAGLLARSASRAPVRTLALSAVIVAAAEVLVAGFSLVLTPAAATTGEIRRLLPVSIGYDLLLWPFALYLVVLLTGTSVARSAAATGPSALHAPTRRAGRRHRKHEPDLRPAAGHRGDGWIGGALPRLRGTSLPRRRPARLHPAAGVPGSATGLVWPHALPARPVDLRFSAGHPGDGAIGSVVGQGGRPGPGRHSGSTPAETRFRPRHGEVGGSAARQFAPAGPGLTRTRINFGGHRHDTTPSGGARSGWLSRPASGATTRVRIRPGSSRSALAPSAYAGLRAAPPKLKFRSTAPPVARRPPATPKFKHATRPLTSTPTTGIVGGPGSSRSALAPSAYAGLRAAPPKLKFRSAAPAGTRRPPATPKFKHATRPLTSTPTTGIVGGRVLDVTAFRASRRGVARPRLRLAASRNRAGMLGGSGHSALRRPPNRARREPRFGHQRRSMLTFMASRGIGGTWLARRRVGSRSGVWVIRRRTGGVR